MTRNPESRIQNPADGDGFTIAARAKVNLGLEILGRRADGYHEIATVLQEIDLADELVFREAPEVSLTCSEPTLADESNLIVRAVRLLQQETGRSAGVAIHLEKRIPVSAGLGGGSSDAAATLVGLNHFWQLRLTEADLGELASRLGSDVPFFIRGGTQLATGRGETLESLPTPSLRLQLVVPTVEAPDKTRRLYQSLRPDDFTTGTSVTRVADALRRTANFRPDLLTSGFTRAASAAFPAVADTLNALRRNGLAPVLCGAGPTILLLGSDNSLPVPPGCRAIAAAAVAAHDAESNQE
jgi:4-diphosphocytidyl-2-C-methyl-D-erythritol kinase